jgi:hypothetical protein
MKSFIVFALLLTSFTASAACPDFSGTYQFDNMGRTEEMVLVQTQCDSLSRALYWFDARGVKTLVQVRTFDLSGIPQVDLEYASISTRTYFDGDALVTEIRESSLALRTTRWWLDRLGRLQMHSGYVDGSGTFVSSLARVGIRQ